MDGKLKNRISKAAERSGRTFSDIKIIGASKFQAIENLKNFKNEIYAFAENYVQEFEEKKELLPDVRWHFIGPLQTNKIRKIIGQIELIHSVGRVEEAREISKRAKEKNVIQKILIEVNLAKENSKHGISADGLAEFLKEVQELEHVHVTGLMAMPPLSDDPENSRKYFKLLKSLAEKFNLPELSMGTSNDFEVAIEEGATMIRLGEILFGPRVPGIVRPTGGQSKERK